jgi:hypothetical protein
MWAWSSEGVSGGVEDRERENGRGKRAQKKEGKRRRGR